MTQLRSTLDPKADTYADAASAAASRSKRSRRTGQALAGGGAKYVERHHDRGNSPPWENASSCSSTPDSPFLELCPLAAYGSAFRSARKPGHRGSARSPVWNA